MKLFKNIIASQFFFIFIFCLVFNGRVYSVEKPEILSEYIENYSLDKKNEILPPAKMENKDIKIIDKTEIRRGFNEHFFPQKLDNKSKIIEKYDSASEKKNEPETKKTPVEPEKKKTAAARARPTASKKMPVENKKTERPIAEKNNIERVNGGVEKNDSIDHLFISKFEPVLKLESVQAPVADQKLLLEELNGNIDMPESRTQPKLLFDFSPADAYTAINISDNIEQKNIETESKYFSGFKKYLIKTQNWLSDKIVWVIIILLVITLIAFFIIRNIMIKDELTMLDPDARLKARDYYKDFLKDDTSINNEINFDIDAAQENTSEYNKNKKNASSQKKDKIEMLRNVSKQYSGKL